MEASFGIARDLGKRWSLGLELRDHNELPEYRKWENTALFLGPVVSYRQEKSKSRNLPRVQWCVSSANNVAEKRSLSSKNWAC